MLRRSVWVAGFLGLSASLAQAEAVPPQALWMDGLQKIQGTFVFDTIASPGGLRQQDLFPGGKRVVTQVSLNELPADLRDSLKKAELQLTVEGPSQFEATQEPSPGPRGKLPFHGHLRHYHETAKGKIRYRGLPGIGNEQGDGGQFEGPVELQLVSESHSDASDFGIYSERQAGEFTWGAAAQSRITAELRAVPAGAADGAGVGNARLMRGGRELFVYFEVSRPSPVAGAETRQWIGSVRLVRTAPAVRP